MSEKYLYGTSRKINVVRETIPLISWLERAKLRKKVFLAIQERTMPSEIVEQLSEEERTSATHYAEVSRALKELQLQGLIKCLNPLEKTGRFYILTEKGKRIKQTIQ